MGKFLKNFTRLSHLPTAILVIGYISYWLELYVIRSGRGVVSPLAYILFITFTLIAIFIQRQGIRSFLKDVIGEYKKQPASIKCILLMGVLIAAAMLVFTLCILLKPPHLPQESDSLRYHLTIPRQHLITGSFRHIWWSSADFFPLPIQFALSPYWFVSDIPSRFIQIFFILGLIALSSSLTARLAKEKFIPASIVTLAILGSHSIGIQMPVLMLDLVLAYLFLASVDSFIKGAYFISMLEFSFLFWSKSFQPLQMMMIIMLTLISALFLRIFKVNKYFYGFDNIPVSSVDKKTVLKISAVFLVFSLFIGMPFVTKSLYYTGTPLFPFYPAITNIFPLDKASHHWQSIIYASKMHLTGRDIYGSGRDLINLLRHFWLIAVPESNMGGVMNRYDYPVGLPYLLFMGPFFYFLAGSIRRKEFPILPVFAVFYWIIWWFGSQQARFLYIPLLIIFISVSAKINIPYKTLIMALFCALLFNFVSIYRAHIIEFKSAPNELIRQTDKQLLELNKSYYKNKNKEVIVLDRLDIAYAQFPAEVKLKGKNHWILEK